MLGRNLGGGGKKVELKSSSSIGGKKEWFTLFNAGSGHKLRGGGQRRVYKRAGLSSKIEHCLRRSGVILGKGEEQEPS